MLKAWCLRCTVTSFNRLKAFFHSEEIKIKNSRGVKLPVQGLWNVPLCTDTLCENLASNIHVWWPACCWKPTSEGCSVRLPTQGSGTKECPLHTDGSFLCRLARAPLCSEMFHLHSLTSMGAENAQHLWKSNSTTHSFGFPSYKLRLNLSYRPHRAVVKIN